jgi:hypothetical protein
MDVSESRLFFSITDILFILGPHLRTPTPGCQPPHFFYIKGGWTPG